MPFQLSDLPERYQKQVRAQLGGTIEHTPTPPPPEKKPGRKGGFIAAQCQSSPGAPSSSPSLSPGGRLPISQKRKVAENRLELRFRGWMAETHGVELERETMTFELGNRCDYTPDYVSVEEGCQLPHMRGGVTCKYRHDYVPTEEEKGGEVVCYEVKGGHFWEDAKVKLKATARMFPWVRFILVLESPKGRLANMPAFQMTEVLP